MSQIDEWLKIIAMEKAEQIKNNEELVKVEGMMEGVEKTSSNPAEKSFAGLIAWLTRLTRVERDDVLYLLQTFLTLLSAQEKEIATLKSRIMPLALEKMEQSKKLEEMEKWRKEREATLSELDEMVKRSRDFQNQNR